MAGLYIHIPFCKSRCIYCGFYSTTGLQLRQRYVDAVCREMSMRMPQQDSAIQETRIETIYIGGGTPSQLSETQMRQLLQRVRGWEAKETTVECNPDDVTPSYAAMLANEGVNRVSMGAQTFSAERLQWLHRRHTPEQVGKAMDALRTAGIHNISVDLMYGFPEETPEQWEQDISAALALNASHISAYCLTYEEGTPLHRLSMANPQIITDEETERQMYERLIDRLQEAGYEHYEISNFARQGFRSRHNSSYWNDTPYIGLGAAAHSYDGQSRQWNVSDIKKYMEAIEQGQIPCEREELDDDTRYNDRVTVALRTREGLDLDELSERHRRYCLQEAMPFIADGLLTQRTHHLALTRKGLFVSDMVMSALMLV